jgi:adenine-specific DNA glycosylase
MPLDPRPRVGRRSPIIRWAAPARPPPPALAGHARPLPRLAVRGHAAADAGGHRARLLRALPAALSHVQALAAAPLDDVLASVERPGLLQPRAQPAPLRAGGGGRTARRRVSPPHSKCWSRLPGIGRSTAAAIAAFCFGERAAILDGNVKRVLTRALGFDGDLAERCRTRSALWALAAGAAAVERRSSRYTQGLMDLGATLCLARRPDCPPARWCIVAWPMPAGHARALPGQDAQAQAQPAPPTPVVAAAWRAGLVWCSGRTTGVWAGAVEPAGVRRTLARSPGRHGAVARRGRGRDCPPFEHT